MHRDSVKIWFETNVYIPWINIRLPRHIKPSYYNLILQPNITHSTFVGTENITISISEPTDHVLLHEIGLRITSTHLISLKSNETIAIDEIFPYKRNHFQVMFFNKMVPEGEYVLKLNFTGTFTDGGDGIGRYSYEDSADSSKK